MANEYTVQFLIMMSLERADLLKIDPASGEQVPVDAMDASAVGLYVNAELTVLWDVLISTHEDYCIKHLKIPVVANTEEYSLPSDFYKFRKVFPLSNGQRGKPLRKFNLKDLGQSTLYPATLGTQIEGTRYKINGNRLWLDPTPTSAAELELWYVPQLEPLVNIKDRVDFMGFVSEQEKIDMLRKSHVVVNPSSKEGWGVTVIEANACGAPVIASDVPGLRDAVVDGETGFLVPYGDIDGFARGIIQVLSDEALRATLSRQAIDWAKRFNWDDSGDAILKVIDKLVQKA